MVVVCPVDVLGCLLRCAPVCNDTPRSTITLFLASIAFQEAILNSLLPTRNHLL